MWGNPGHLDEMARKIRAKWSGVKNSQDGKFHVLLATTNVDNYTYDGVDHGGERVADEVRPFRLFVFPMQHACVPATRFKSSLLDH